MDSLLQSTRKYIPKHLYTKQPSMSMEYVLTSTEPDRYTKVLSLNILR
jgi:hypothetical protein